MAPRDIAKEVRPLIGLTNRQVEANQNYRQKVYERYREHGASERIANERADKAALKYAGKQHRYRAESIVLTENAFAYNRGAHMGVSQSIADGYMGRCEMVWTTAGTNRVCGRCLELKDRVVGHTDESGVTLPPLHPRCRCAIMYREVGTPRVMQPKPKPRGLAAGNIDSLTTEGSPPKLIGKLENMTPALIQKTLEHYEKQIVNAPIENAIIITRAGDIYHCTGGLNSLETIEELGEKLYGAYVTHNHPVGSDNEYSFSELDWYLFGEFKLGILHGIDEKFIYELNRNPNDLDTVEIVAGKYDYKHWDNTRKAKNYGYGYRRWERGRK